MVQATVAADVGAGAVLSSGGNIRIESDAVNNAQATATALVIGVCLAAAVVGVLALGVAALRKNGYGVKTLQEYH